MGLGSEQSVDDAAVTPRCRHTHSGGVRESCPDTKARRHCRGVRLFPPLAMTDDCLFAAAGERRGTLLVVRAVSFLKLCSSASQSPWPS